MRATVRKLKTKLRKDDTVERCGVVLKDGRVLQVDNVHPNPELGFAIPGCILLQHEDNLAGAWHTHPKGSSILSQEDYQGFNQWPNLTHYIVGRDGVRAYKVSDGIIEELNIAAG